MSDMFGDLPNSGPIYTDGQGTNIPDNSNNNNNNDNNNITINNNNNNNNNNKNPSKPDWPVNPDFPQDNKIIDPNSGYVPPNEKDKGTSDNYIPFDPNTNPIPSDEIIIKPQDNTNSVLVILGILA